MANERRRLRFPTILQMLLVSALITLWVVFLLQQTKLRMTNEAPARTHGFRASQPTEQLVANAARAGRFVRALAGDVLFGFGTIALLWMGSRPFVRRVETWLEARGSGEAMSLGGTDLTAQAIAANADRGGVLQ
jgi:hypothetical protein